MMRAEVITERLNQATDENNDWLTTGTNATPTTIAIDSSAISHDVWIRRFNFQNCIPSVYTMCHTITSMSDIQVFKDKTLLAEAAAKRIVEILGDAVDEYSRATWVLAGGSTPLLAYKIIASNYTDAIDWASVTIVIGDERIGSLDSEDNNWQAIDKILGGLPLIKIRPMSDLTAEEAAEDYSNQLANLPTADNGLPRFDLLMLGVGEDGHTLSLFPQHASLLPTSDIVIPVHDSPKPPSDRISLSLRAVQGVQTALVLASGTDKKEAVEKGQKGAGSPIGLVASIIETHEGKVVWFIDHDAA
jgi:6-phosphogluconolactonase